MDEEFFSKTKITFNFNAPFSDSGKAFPSYRKAANSDILKVVKMNLQVISHIEVTECSSLTSIFLIKYFIAFCFLNL